MDDSGSNPGMYFVSTQLFIQSEAGVLSEKHEFYAKNAWKSTSEPPVPSGGGINFV
jgi:hypothetical protein